MGKHPLLEQARRERDEERSRLAEQERAAAEARRPHTAALVERFSVWWNLRREWHTGVGLLGGLGLWFSFGLIPLPTKIPSLVCAALGVVGCALLAKSHQSLRAWRAKLPFDVRGWTQIVDDPLFYIEERWWHAVLTLDGPLGADEREALLHRLCARMERTWYVAETPSDDARLRWKVVDGAARGSLNRHGTLQLARWCLDDVLAPGFAARVNRVELAVDEEAFHVSRPSSD